MRANAKLGWYFKATPHNSYIIRDILFFLPFFSTHLWKHVTLFTKDRSRWWFSVAWVFVPVLTIAHKCTKPSIMSPCKEVAYPINLCSKHIATSELSVTMTGGTFGHLRRVESLDCHTLCNEVMSWSDIKAALVQTIFNHFDGSASIRVNRNIKRKRKLL